MTRPRRLPSGLGADLAAGLAIGIVSIPQAMAFALVAGVPAAYALYAMIIPGVIAGLLRRSPHLVTGATNTAALLTASLLAASPYAVGLGLPAALAAASLLVGLTQTVIGAAGLGRLARYVSPSVVVGFTLGAAVLIGASQLPTALGLEVAGGGRALARLAATVASLDRVDADSLWVAGATLAVLAGARALHPRLPGPVLGVAAGTGVGLALGGDGLRLVGAVPAALPAPAWPPLDLDLLDELLGPALAIALVGLAENVSIGKSLSRLTERRFHADRELLAQGLANAGGALFACLPSSVSWTRSAVSLEAGARTPAAGLLASATVLAAILLAGPYARHIPLASVAAVVLWIAARMVRIEDLRRLRHGDRPEVAVLIVTFLATLLVDLELAVFAGVALSLGLVVRRAGLLHLSEFAQAPGGQLVERPLDAQTGSAPVTLLQAEGDLFFGVADALEERLDALAASGSRAIVLRLKRTHAVDDAAAEALARFAARFGASGGILLLCGLRPDMRARIEASELGRALGEDALDETADRPFESLRRALERARRHLGLPHGARLVRVLDEPPSEPSFSI